MDFGKALEAMKADKKVRLPELPQGWYIVIGDVAWDNMIMYKTFMLVKGNEKNYESLKLIPRILLSNEWEILEDVPEVQLHTKGFFTCPKCGHVNMDITIENTFLTCRECGIKVKILSDSVDYHMILKTYKQLLEKITNDMELEIMVSSRNSNPSNWRFSDSLSAFKQCLKMLTQLEVEASEQQCNGTN